MMLTDTFRIILAILATYRISNLIALDNGPFDIIRVTRSYIGRKAAIGSAAWKTLAGLTRCPLCLGIWVSIIATITLYCNNMVIDFIMITLAIAGGQSVIYMIAGYVEDE